MLIPGFRSHNKTKKAIAIVYYLMALLSAGAGIENLLMLVSLPFIFFSAADLIRKKRNHSSITLLISSLVLILTVVIFPGGKAAPSQSLINSASPGITQTGSPEPTDPYEGSKISAGGSDGIKEGNSTETPGTPLAPGPAGTPAQAAGALEVHFIDVGQADAILITQKNSAMLIDAGNNADAELVTEYLKDSGIKRLDYVVGTHPHEDHIGGLDAVIKSFEIGSVIMPKAESTSRTFEDLLTAISEKSLKITRPIPGNRYSLGDAEFVIFAPNSGTYEELNDFSIVLKLTYGNNSFLFTGDAEVVSENEMLAAGADLEADVLKVGHHGSDSSTSEKFIKSVSPKYAVISVGSGNSYGHPTQETLSALKNQGVTIYRTDELGSVTAVSDGKTITFKSRKKIASPTPKPSPSATPKPSATPSSTPKPAVTPKPTTVPSPSAGSTGKVVIEKVDLQGELVTITNNSSTDVNLTGWRLVSVTGGQEFYFPNGVILKSDASLTIASGEASGDLKWNRKNVWNNDGDPAELYDSSGKLISKY